jgi:benzylsuccinate CoA-transferase BbsF subunit
MGPAFMDYELNGRVGGPLGNRHPTGAAVPHGVFPAAGDDQWISIAVFADDEWAALVAALGRPEWALDARFAATAGRREHLDEIHRRLGEVTRAHDGEDLARRLQAVGVAAAPVLDIPGLLTNEHLCARPTFATVDHPLGFSETISAPYVRTSGFDIDLRPGPVMGRDNERVFKGWLGLDAVEYEDLVRSGVIH